MTSNRGKSDLELITEILRRSPCLGSGIGGVGGGVDSNSGGKGVVGLNMNMNDALQNNISSCLTGGISTGH